jgi:hypothetical protein
MYLSYGYLDYCDYSVINMTQNILFNRKFKELIKIIKDTKTIAIYGL